MGGQGKVRNQENLSYFPIPLHLYHAGDLLDYDLYFFYQQKYILYRVKNLIWKEEDRKQLENFNINALYICCENAREHQLFLESHLQKILNQPEISVSEKAQALYSTSMSIAQEVFDRPASSENLRRSMGSIKHSIDYLSKDKDNFFELMALAQLDFNEYTHAIHVSAYAITLGRQVGFRSFNEISALGTAAILHDIGKTKIDPRILNKPSALTDAERKEVERHPEYSFEIVHRSGTVPKLAEHFILQHHERIDGSGYPRGSSGELELGSRLIALVDCFDSLTSERTYQKAMKPMEAIKYLQTELRNEYDQNLLIEFIKMLKR